jgi:ribonucleoside-diphosphate reductase beta chain
MPLTQERLAYKPLEYPWAIEAFKKQHAMHWLPDEAPLGDDIIDFNTKLTPAEKHLLTQIFRFFTQSDIEVNNCYHSHYSKIFKPVEIKMMLGAFADFEGIHILAYSHLLDTLKLPEIEYSAFLGYKQMRDKHDFMNSFNMDSPLSIAETLAGFGAFTEGVSLFASFAILMNFPRFNRLKGMGDIIAWSIRDESLHCESIIKLFHTWVLEHPEINRHELKMRIVKIAQQTIIHEDAFIDLAFELGPVQGLSSEEVKRYIRYVANIRMKQLGYDPIYDIDVNPLPFMTEMVNIPEFANFFESRSTEYSKGQTQGEWEDMFD